LEFECFWRGGEVLVLEGFIGGGASKDAKKLASRSRFNLNESLPTHLESIINRTHLKTECQLPIKVDRKCGNSSRAPAGLLHDSVWKKSQTIVGTVSRKNF
jgi:hypothetical protein